MQGVSFVETRN